MRPGRYWPWFGAGAVVLLGLALRLAYYHSSNYSQPDEPITVAVVKHLRESGDFDTNWAKADVLYPFRYDQYNYSSYLYAVYGFYGATGIVPGLGELHWGRDGFWAYRLFSVLLGTLVVAQTMHLGWQGFGRGVGIFAGGLVAVSVLLVQDAHYIRPDSFLTALTLLTVILCLRPGVAPRGRIRAAGFVIGLLIATKVSMVLLAWLPSIPILATEESLGRRVRTGLEAAVMIFAGFATGAPGAVLHPGEFLNGVHEVMKQYAGGSVPHTHSPPAFVGDILAKYFIATLGWPLLLACGLGIAALVYRRRYRELAVIGGPLLVFTAYFATQHTFFERNLSNVLPLALILAAFGASEMVALLGQRSWFIVGAVVSLLVVTMSWTSVTYTHRMVFGEMSGDGARRARANDDAVASRYPGVERRSMWLIDDEDALRERLRADPSPFLLRALDFHDDLSRQHLAKLHADFQVEDVDEFRGPFPKVPVSTLLTYFSPDSRYLLVKGIRPH